jgi:NAD(P)-dependent dehydrogenase (short-subunit alcohol dehydrogenase family)
MVSSTGPMRLGALAVVTGAGSGIGRATAVRLAEDGWTVTLVDRDPDGLAVTGELVRAGGSCGALLEADLSDRRSIASAVTPYLETEPVELLVNNAGVGFRASTPETTDEQWDLTIAVNLTAMFQLCRDVIPGMVSRGGGVIINMASVAGLVGLSQRVAYCASKAGVIGLTRALAADHAAQGLRINAIAPGTVETEWIGRMLADDPDAEATRARMQARQLDGRLGTPDEIAGGIAFMAGQQGRFFNGAVMTMDGGITAV